MKRQQFATSMLTLAMITFAGLLIMFVPAKDNGQGAEGQNLGEVTNLDETSSTDNSSTAVSSSSNPEVFDTVMADHDDDDWDDDDDYEDDEDSEDEEDDGDSEDEEDDEDSEDEEDDED